MEAINRNVRDIEAAERRVLEHLIGQQLKENQKTIIQLVSLGSQPAESPDESCDTAGTTPGVVQLLRGAEQ